MTGSGLNHLFMIIHIYKEETGEIDIKLIVNKFIKAEEFVIASFGLY